MANSTTKLYIVATPLGNLEDVSQRAIETLRQAAAIIAEDTRECQKLFGLLGIDFSQKRFFSYANHNLKEMNERVEALVEQFKVIALVTDRGTPAISDPGSLLVKRAVELEVKIIPIPGASSVTSLLSVSGFDLRRFLFLGFLPVQEKEKLSWFDEIKNAPKPFCFFESPRRIKETLREIQKHFPTSRICIGRELTKIHEEIIHCEMSELNPDAVTELGEFTVAVEPMSTQDDKSIANWEKEVEMRALTDREWSKRVAQQHGVSASTIYNALQKQKG